MRISPANDVMFNGQSTIGGRPDRGFPAPSEFVLNAATWIVNVCMSDNYCCGSELNLTDLSRVRTRTYVAPIGYLNDANSKAWGSVCLRYTY